MRGLYDGGYQLVPPCVPGRHDDAAHRLRPERRVLDRAAVLVEAVVPGLLDEGLGHLELSGHAIEHVEEPVAVGPQHQLARPALPLHVDEHRNLRGVPVVLVAGRELVVPLQFSRVGVERDHAVGIQVVGGRARVAVPARVRIAGSPERQVRFRIVAAGVPDRDCRRASTSHPASVFASGASAEVGAVSNRQSSLPVLMS